MLPGGIGGLLWWLWEGEKERERMRRPVMGGGLRGWGEEARLGKGGREGGAGGAVDALFGKILDKRMKDPNWDRGFSSAAGNERLLPPCTKASL